MLTELSRKLFTLNKLKGVGPATLEKLVALPTFATASINELALANPKVAKALPTSDSWELAESAASEDLDRCTRSGTQVISVLDDTYPRLLLRTPDRPYFIYVQGHLSKDPTRSVAVIGTRNPTDHGKLVAQRITEFLVDDDWSIVSGLALGCDVIAHQTALSNDGHTVAVLAHGLQTIAPKQHANVAAQILDKGGALITEYAYGIEPFAPQYVKRDRIQAGLSRGVVMIQSDRQGGSMHASRATIEYKRLLAIPKPTDRDLSNQEIKIESNRILSEGSDSEKLELLKCKLEDLRRVLIIRSKDDYADLRENLLST